MGADAAATWAALDWYARVKVVALSATLPLLAIYLTRVVETAVDARQDTATVDKGAAEGDTDQGHSSDQSTAPDRGGDRDIAGDTTAPARAPLRLSLNGHDLAPGPALWTTVVETRPADVPLQDKPARPRPVAGQAKLTPARYRDIAREHVPDGTGAQEADRIVARVAGTSTKTAQRARLAMS